MSAIDSTVNSNNFTKQIEENNGIPKRVCLEEKINMLSINTIASCYRQSGFATTTSQRDLGDYFLGDLPTSTSQTSPNMKGHSRQSSSADDSEISKKARIVNEAASTNSG